MKILICLVAAVSVASAGVMLDPYDSPVGSVGAASAAYQASNDNYGSRTETRCTPYFEDVQNDHCENYVERTCTTTQRESCQDVNDQNCRAVVSSKQVRKCFNVTEQRCGLREDVQLDTIQVPIVVQKCHRVNERVCDTVYDSSSNVKESSECINLENTQCENVEQTLFDTTCRTTTTFDCDTSAAGGYGANAGGAVGGAAGGAAGGYGGNAGAGGAGSGSGAGYGGESSYGSTTPYGQPQINCRRKQDTKCYKTPRTVTVPQCSRRTERVCEPVRVAAPFVTARQSCRNEEKKVCDLEERTQPKQVKKYVYSKQCQAVPRTVCENADQKSLVPSCVGTTRKQCTYSPVEQCQDTPKEHCFKVNQRVRRERCEQVQVGGYGNTQPAGQDY